MTPGARYLITGAGGMLGGELQVALDGRRVTALTRDQLDVTDAEAVRAAVAGHDIVINAAAYTAVDAAEDNEAQAHAVNATAVANLARACAERDARLVQLSTDYVFAGDAVAPYAESAPLAPISAYGRTKAEGERLARSIHPEGALIVRAAWLYGEHGPNFVSTIMSRAMAGETLVVVDDQRGQPTWTAEVAMRIRELLDRGVARGIVHATASGETTWFGLARAIVRGIGLDSAIVRAGSSADSPRRAPRPRYSVLGHDGWMALGFTPLRPWDDALVDALPRLLAPPRP